MSPDYFAFFRKVEFWDSDVFLEYVLPYVHLGPVRDREHTEVFSHTLLTVEQVPELWALVLRIPLTEVIAVREEATS